MSVEALERMYALVLEDTRRWGVAAADFQVEDAEAVLSDERPNWHFLTRARGGSKSTDIAGMAISWLTTDARPLANGHIVASSTEQASIIIDAIAGFVRRTPELEDQLVVESQRVISANGAWVRVLAQSDSGAWGLRDAHLLIVDEFAQWPRTRGARRVWEAITSTAPKVPNCRLIVLTSAGEPSHWSFDEIKKCKSDPLWNVHEVPGPVPWLAPDELESLRWRYPPSVYERLVLNIWSEDEDRAISEQDWEIAKETPIELREDGQRTIMRLRWPVDGVKYISTVDVGLVNDATVLAIAHKEPLDKAKPNGPQRAVIDYMERWKGSKRNPIQLPEVRAWLATETPKWNRAHVYADPTQFMGTLQDVNRMGVRAEDWPFTASSVGQIATALVTTFRTRQIIVPDAAVLREELLRVKIRQNAAGVTRLDSTGGGHDDQAVCIGLACFLLLGQSGWGEGAAWMQAMRDTMVDWDEHPEKYLPSVARPRDYFFGQDPLEAAIPQVECRKPRFFPPEMRCVNCGKTPDVHPKAA